MRRLVLAAFVLLVLAEAAAPAPAPSRSATAPLVVRCGDSTISLETRWTFPVGARARGFVWLQHGFARSGKQVASLADRLARERLIVAAPSVDSFGRCTLGDSALLTNVAPILAASAAPRGALSRSARLAATRAGVRGFRALPADVALAGHSAGAAAVSFVAADLVERFPRARPRLKGLVLLDPVESASGAIASSLPRLTGVRIHAVSAPPGRCNADGSGTRVLQAGRRGFVGMRLTSGCHCDAEGGSTDSLCIALCGRPLPGNVAALQRLTAGWLGDGFRRTRTGRVLSGRKLSAAATGVPGRRSPLRNDRVSEQAGLQSSPSQ